MAGNDKITSFTGTSKQVREFLNRQITPTNGSWVVRNHKGTRVYFN